MSICRSCIHKSKGHPQWSSHYCSCQHPSVRGGKEGLSLFGIEVPEEALNEGWVSFPFNFDPIWITKCEGYEAIE